VVVGGGLGAVGTPVGMVTVFTNGSVMLLQGRPAHEARLRTQPICREAELL